MLKQELQKLLIESYSDRIKRKNKTKANDNWVNNFI